MSPSKGRPTFVPVAVRDKEFEVEMEESSMTMIAAEIYECHSAVDSTSCWMRADQH